MSKSKPARSVRRRSVRKARPAQQPQHPRPLDIMRSTGWQQHSVRGFFAGVVRRKLGFKLESEKTDGERVYRIAAGSGCEPGNSAPASA